MRYRSTLEATSYVLTHGRSFGFLVATLLVAAAWPGAAARAQDPRPPVYNVDCAYVEQLAAQRGFVDGGVYNTSATVVPGLTQLDPDHYIGELGYVDSPWQPNVYQILLGAEDVGKCALLFTERTNGTSRLSTGLTVVQDPAGVPYIAHGSLSQPKGAFVVIVDAGYVFRAFHVSFISQPQLPVLCTNAERLAQGLGVNEDGTYSVRALVSMLIARGWNPGALSAPRAAFVGSNPSSLQLFPASSERGQCLLLFAVRANGKYKTLNDVVRVGGTATYWGTDIVRTNNEDGSAFIGVGNIAAYDGAVAIMVDGRGAPRHIYYYLRATPAKR